MKDIYKRGTWAAAAIAVALALAQAPGCRRGTDPGSAPGAAAAEAVVAKDAGASAEPAAERREQAEPEPTPPAAAEPARPAAGATEITDADLEKALAEGVVLLELYAPDCPACRVQIPIVDALAGEYDGRARVLKIDVDRNQRAMYAFRVEYIPTLVVLRDGRVMRRMVGLNSREQLKAALDAALD